MRGVPELRVTLDGVGRHNNLEEPFIMCSPFHSMSAEVELIGRSSGQCWRWNHRRWP
ncbi:hypothetical protein V3C99_016692 [Haemonchus contortus]